MSDGKEEPETPEEAKARLLASRIPVYVPGMRSFPFGIYPFYPDARLEPYTTMLVTCSYVVRLFHLRRLRGIPASAFCLMTIPARLPGHAPGGK